jgi:hypothetical protein
LIPLLSTDDKSYAQILRGNGGDEGSDEEHERLMRDDPSGEDSDGDDYDPEEDRAKDKAEDENEDGSDFDATEVDGGVDGSAEDGTT